MFGFGIGIFRLLFLIISAGVSIYLFVIIVNLIRTATEALKVYIDNNKCSK